jgi:uncharacterized membrane protein YoaK (UPF0700 family)
MDAIMTAKMVGGIATAAIHQHPKPRDLSVATLITRTAPRHALRAQPQCAPGSQAMHAIWIVMGMVWAANKKLPLHRANPKVQQ